MADSLDLVSKVYNVSYRGQNFFVADAATSKTVECVLTEWQKLPDFSSLQIKSLLDLGANVGMFSFYLKRLYPQLELTAVEPVNLNLSNLKLGLIANGFDANLIEAAVTAEPPTNLFSVDLNNTGGCGFHPCEKGSGIQISVRTTTLDELITRPYDLVKCDIEGSEFDAFANFNRWDNIGSLFLELHTYPARESKEDQDKLAQEFGAFVVSKMEGKPVWIPGVTCCFE